MIIQFGTAARQRSRLFIFFILYRLKKQNPLRIVPLRRQNSEQCQSVPSVVAWADKYEHAAAVFTPCRMFFYALCNCVCRIFHQNRIGYADLFRHIFVAAAHQCRFGYVKHKFCPLCRFVPRTDLFGHAFCRSDGHIRSIHCFCFSVRKSGDQSAVFIDSLRKRLNLAAVRAVNRDFLIQC